MGFSFFQFLNIIGLLSVQNKGNELKLSSVQILLNFTKIVALYLFRLEIVLFFVYNFNSSMYENHHSRFSGGFILWHALWPINQATTTMILQLIKAHSNAELLNTIRRFRNTTTKIFPSSKNIFYDQQKICFRNIQGLVIVTAVCFLLGFYATMVHNLLGLSAFLSYCLPYFINMSLISYFYVIIQFVVAAQRALILVASELSRSSNIDNVTWDVDSLSILQSSLRSIRKTLVEIFSMPITMISFHFTVEFLYYVRRR